MARNGSRRGVAAEGEGMRLVVGFTGGPGAAYGVRLLEVLRATPVETHLVMCPCARQRVAHETGRAPEEVVALADRVYGWRNQAARISSGSFLTAGMVVAPCSARSLASIALGLASNLIHRAADVTLKERRRLVLLVAPEVLGPLQGDHLRRLADAGAAVVAPQGGAGGLDGTVGGILDRFGIPRPTG